jgi:hypothetical protein
VDVAALRMRDSILTSAETEGLTYQAYWLSTTLALGAFLKVPAWAAHLLSMTVDNFKIHELVLHMLGL